MMMGIILNGARTRNIRVPDAVRHSSCRPAEPGPRFSEDSWAPALQRTASQELRAALRPGHEDVAYDAFFARIKSAKRLNR
jgi:hypothetical protein